MAQANSERTPLDTAARGGEVVGGIVKIARGIATGDYVAVAQGAAAVAPPKVIAIIVLTAAVMLLIPIIIIIVIPQMLFSWGTVQDPELLERNAYAGELVSTFESVIASQEEGVNPDIYWLVVIECVRAKQDIASISRTDVTNAVKRSFVKNSETGEIRNKSPDEIMDGLGFTDEQKNWANLMHEGLEYQFVDPTSEYGDAGGLENYDGVTLGGAGETQVVYFNQLDPQWANTMYGRSSTIGKAGCGPTSLAIAVSTLTGRTVTPVQVANWSVANGYRCEGNGSYHSLIPEGAKHYGLKVEMLGRSSAAQLREHLSSGKLVIAIMAKGHFTSSGHFIVLRGVTADGKVLVADPASYKRSSQAWDMSIILNEARGTASAGGPFWSLSK